MNRGFLSGTFVVFLSRVIGYAVDSFLREGDDRSGPGIGYVITTLVLDIVLFQRPSPIKQFSSSHLLCFTPNG